MSKIREIKDPLLKKIGEKVKLYREQQGYNRDVFARECEISKYFLYRLEYGNINVSILALKKVADFLGVDLKNFFE